MGGSRTVGLPLGTAAAASIVSFLLLKVHVSEANVESTLSSSDPYDDLIFDPSSLYGAPLGGYARASRHRLAQLPLRLVGGAEFDGWGGTAASDAVDNVGEDVDAASAAQPQQTSSSPPHFRLSDADGRQYICRVYREDELDPYSILGSMFDPPVLRVKAPPSIPGHEGAFGAEQDETDDEHDEYYEDDEEYYMNHTPDGDVIQKTESQTMQIIGEDSATGVQVIGTVHTTTGGIYQKPVPGAVTAQQEQVSETSNEPVHIDPHDIGIQLGKLQETCAQHHSGWWSYEWCNEKQVSQFHVHVKQVVETDQDGNTLHFDKQMEIQDVTTVGKFKQRSVRIGEIKASSKARRVVVDQGDGREHLAGEVVVTDTFDSGDWCDEFAIHRSVQVEIRCCPDLQEQAAKRKDVLFGKAVLKSVVENGQEKCTYKTMVCSHLLCPEAFEAENKKKVEHTDGESTSGNEDIGDGTGQEGEGGAYENIPPKRKRRKKKKESIRDILDRALGNHCLQRNAGWWTYEFCHTRHAREFHGTNVMDATTGVSRQIVEEEHMMGVYKAEVHESYPDIEEPDHVINATHSDGEDPLVVGSRKKNKAKAKKKEEAKKKVDSSPPEAGGNGSVFIQEYTDGLVCEDSDVAESIIKGGNVVGGGIERSTTVRFSCGKNYELVRVNEDSTCHYIFDVAVPALCSHPLFKATLPKTQVVKCLPVPEQ